MLAVDKSKPAHAVPQAKLFIAKHFKQTAALWGYLWGLDVFAYCTLPFGYA